MHFTGKRTLYTRHVNVQSTHKHDKLPETWQQKNKSADSLETTQDKGETFRPSSCLHVYLLSCQRIRKASIVEFILSEPFNSGDVFILGNLLLGSQFSSFSFQEAGFVTVQ